MNFRNLIPTFVLFILFGFSQVSGATYTTTSDGAWGSAATWGGSTVSVFSNVSPNWFTSGLGDIIIIQHTVTMDYNIFLRPNDILIIQAGGSLNAGAFGSFYNLSAGQGGFLLDGVQSGLYIYGQMNVGYLRNTALMTLASSGLLTVTTGAGGGLGNLDNFGDFFITGDLLVSGGGDINHNAGDIYIYSGGNVEIDGGDFNNRSVIRNLFPDSCIRLLGGSFNNLLGAVVVGSGGVSADINVDNSANPPTAWSGASWCAGVAGLNMPPSLEDCTHPCAQPLPVELVSFDATLETNETVILEWETDWELNAKDFAVEKSSDNENFSDLGTIAANGTTYEPSNYYMVDEKPFGVTYYRLRQTDLNGAVTYSEIKSVVLEGLELDFDFYPNPADQQLTLNLRPSGDELAVLHVYDQMGNELIVQELNSLHENIDVSGLAPGIYFLNVVAGQEKVSKKLAIK